MIAARGFRAGGAISMRPIIENLRTWPRNLCTAQGRWFINLPMWRHVHFGDGGLSTSRYGGLSTSQYGSLSKSQYAELFTSQYGGLSTSSGGGMSTSSSDVYKRNILLGLCS